MSLLHTNELNNFLKNHATAVVATVDENGKPSTSTIYYLVGKNDEIWFLTKSDTTKFVNLKKNNQAAITVVDSSEPVAVNLSGRVSEAETPEDRDHIIQEITKLANTLLHDFAPIIKLHRGSFKAMRFIPEHAKMTDYRQPIGQAEETLKDYK